MSGLREVLIESFDEWLFRMHGVTSSCRHEVEVAEIEAAVLAWLDERLAEGDVLEAVMRAIFDNALGDPAKGEPMVRVERRATDMYADATAALEAVRGVVGRAAVAAANGGDLRG